MNLDAAANDSSSGRHTTSRGSGDYVGRGSATGPSLTDVDVREIVEQASSRLKLDGKKVLLIIPDATRTCPIGMMLREVNRVFNPKVARLDIMIALGTHRPMTTEEIYKFTELSEEAHRRDFTKTEFFNHSWDDPKTLRQIGVLDAAKVRELSHGRLTESIPVAINEKVFAYDQLVIIGPTFPHEVVGFSGGNKYFFPGIAGQKIIDAFHWLGALITNRKIIGTHYTPVRAVVDSCAAMITVPKYCFSLVVSSKGFHGLYGGVPEEAYEHAARLSAEVNVKWFDRPFKKVISICPPMYPELWTAGKCMYKLEPVIEKGGELIIYAPHLTEVSRTHGHNIERIGYHVLQYFTSQMDKFADIPPGVIAHSTHVKGDGTYKDGVETPFVNVVVASQLPPELCKKINLGYADYKTIDVDSFRGREAEGVLVVDKAGEVLHKLNSDRQ